MSHLDLELKDSFERVLLIVIKALMILIKRTNNIYIITLFKAFKWCISRAPKSQVKIQVQAQMGDRNSSTVYCWAATFKEHGWYKDLPVLVEKYLLLLVDW